MEKKNIIYWVIIVALVIVLTIFLVLLINQNTEKASKPERTTYVLPPKTVIWLFDSTVEEFFVKDFAFNQYCEDYQKHALVDNDGNLVLKLTKDQENGMLVWLGDRSGRARSAGMEISNDYTHITYVCTAKEFMNNYPFLLHYELGFRQLFSGKDPASIRITYTIIGKTTNKVIYDVTWPESELVFDSRNPDWY